MDLAECSGDGIQYKLDSIVEPDRNDPRQDIQDRKGDDQSR
jgi:hypothetical protein